MTSGSAVESARPPARDRLLYRARMRPVDARWREWLVQDLDAPGAPRRYEASEVAVVLVLMLIAFGVVATMSVWVAVVGCLLSFGVAALRIAFLSDRHHQKRKQKLLKWRDR